MKNADAHMHKEETPVYFFLNLLKIYCKKKLVHKTCTVSFQVKKHHSHTTKLSIYKYDNF